MNKNESNDFSSSPNITVFKNALNWCDKYLLRQGPLEYFVHHNTLHAFESVEFIDALFKAKHLFQAKTHMSAKWFQKQKKEGRITEDDLAFAKQKHLGSDYQFNQILEWNEDIILSNNSYKNEFLSHFLQNKTEQDDAFFQVSSFWDHTKSSYRTNSLKNKLESHRYKFLSTFFDKGTAYWSMEQKTKGMNYCFQDYINYLPKTRINKSLKEAYNCLTGNNSEISQCLETFQRELGLPLEYINQYLFQVLNATKGWTGLVYSLEENIDFNPTKIKASKNEYIIFCLSFELAGFFYLRDQKDLHPIHYVPNVKTDTSFHILSYLYDNLLATMLSDKEVQSLFIKNSKQLISLDQRIIIQVWQEAYEAHLYFNLIEAHHITSPTENHASKLQVVTCIDDREESTRRYFEEYSKDVETFGYAGHFGLNIKYRSLRDAHFRALCPLNANPSKYVFEEVLPGELLSFKKLAKQKHFIFHNSNLPLFGSLLTFLLGPITGALFIFESFAPKFMHNLIKRIKKFMYPKVKTRLNYWKRKDSELDGFTDEELANAAQAMISVLGINNSFAEIVLLCGHGSKSMNNPHGAAYNCGACAGGKGAPNARLMATALNKEEIRNILKERGILIPKNVSFVGGYHCTSSGKILFFDDQILNKDQQSYLKTVCRYVERADSKERMRKFENVSLSVTAEEAFSYAQSRAYDFSQPRPEYGHNTNAFSLVGQRQTSKSLFLDRRAFLISYNSQNDLDGKNLSSLLSAVIPVCAGISLEYYFSFVDQDKFGAGVKQAHNVTSLIGVMNGYQSDLQMGLPWQMVEIHEPARNTFLIEADKEKFENVLKENKEVNNLVLNEWVRIILKCPNGPYLLYGKSGLQELVPPVGNISQNVDSLATYQNKREILNVSIQGAK